MDLIKGANLALTFFLELVLLVAFGVWGFAAGQGGVTAWVLGIGTPVLVAVIWGVFMAPKAVRPLQAPLHHIAELIIFSLGVAALYAAGHILWAVVFGIVFGMNFILRLLWKQGTTDRRAAV